MRKVMIRTEGYEFFYCRHGKHQECSGEFHSELHRGRLEELCTCPCHGPEAAKPGSSFREMELSCWFNSRQISQS